MSLLVKHLGYMGYIAWYENSNLVHIGPFSAQGDYVCAVVYDFKMTFI